MSSVFRQLKFVQKKKQIPVIYDCVLNIDQYNYLIVSFSLHSSGKCGFRLVLGTGLIFIINFITRLCL